VACQFNNSELTFAEFLNHFVELKHILLIGDLFENFAELFALFQ
jgi:hypothetical protein